MNTVYNEEGNRCYKCQHYNSTFCLLMDLFGYCDFKPKDECMESEDNEWQARVKNENVVILC